MKKTTKRLLSIASAITAMGMAFSLCACGGNETTPACKGHVDADRNGKCDLCEQVMVVPELPSCVGHKDEDADGKCDLCEETMYVAPAPSADPHDIYEFEGEQADVSYRSELNTTTFTGTFLRGDLSAEMTLSVNASAENVGELKYTWVLDEKYTQSVWDGEETPVSDYTAETKTATVAVAWRMNEDWPKYESYAVVADIDASEDGLLSAQKIYLNFDPETNKYIGTFTIQGNEITIAAEVEQIAKLRGNAVVTPYPDLMPEFTATVQGALTLYGDGTVHYTVDDGLYGMSGVSIVDTYGTYVVTRTGYEVTVGETVIAVTKSGTAYTATVTAAEDVDIALSYDSANILMTGEGKLTANEQENDMIVQLSANIVTKKATLEILMKTEGGNYTILCASKATASGNIMEGMCMEIGEGTITDGDTEGSYKITFGSGDSAFELTYTVDGNGNYSSTVRLTGFLDSAVTVTYTA